MTLEIEEEKSFEFLGYKIKLRPDTDRETVKKAIGLLTRELEGLPTNINTNTERLLLIALKIAADKVDQSNKILAKIQGIEKMIDEIPLKITNDKTVPKDQAQII